MAKTKRRQTDASKSVEQEPRITFTPKNLKQRDYLRSIRDNTITYGIGAAGSGKTFLAAQSAMDAFEKGLVQTITVCRPVVTASNEKLGYLPGNIEEKMDPYLRPIFNVFSERWSPKSLHLYRMERRIDVIPFGFMRGITLKNTFVIADEAQNTNLEQMLMLLTRLGENTRMVITGDPEQADIRANTLEETRRRLAGIEGIGWIEFDPGDVIRHPLVEDILRSWNRE